MVTDIKNQHYVWRHYLKPWLSGKKIWCIRDANPFLVNVEKIAKEHYFYAIEQLNDSEKKLIEMIISVFHPSGQPLLKSVYDIYLTSSYGSEHSRKNAIENYHSTVERSAISILDKLYTGDLSFWGNENERNKFSYFIGVQYSRTKKVRDRLTIAFNNIRSHPECPIGIDPHKIAKAYSFLNGDIIGNWLSSSTYPILIDNNSETSFLTSDQPVYNLNANFSNDLIPPKEFQLYYPITPNKALIFKSKSDSEIDENHNNYNFYNDFIIKSSNEFVFSNSKKVLISYFKGQKG